MVLCVFRVGDFGVRFQVQGVLVVIIMFYSRFYSIGTKNKIIYQRYFYFSHHLKFVLNRTYGILKVNGFTMNAFENKVKRKNVGTGNTRKT